MECILSQPVFIKVKLINLISEGITEEYTYVAPSKIPGAGKGLFAAKDIKKGQVILTAKITHIPDEEWYLLKTWAPELLKRYGYSWGGFHAAVLGKNWPGFRLSPEAKKAIAHTVLKSGFHEFNFINDSWENPNVSERFKKAGIIEVWAIADIPKGSEILKRYPPDGTATYKPDAFSGKYKDFNWLKESHQTDLEKEMDKLAVSVVENTSYKDWQEEAIETLVSRGTPRQNATKTVSEWSNDTMLNFLTDKWKKYWRHNPNDFKQEYENHFG
jgi:hypothetical protein